MSVRPRLTALPTPRPWQQAGLAALLLLAADASHARETATQPTTPTKVADPARLHCVESDGSLHQNRVYFDGKCRKLKFFERFLSEGANLWIAAGPRTGESDSGVIVTEIIGQNLTQELYILPDKAGSGEARLRGQLYRADYPVVAIRSYQTWQDAQGFVHSASFDQGTVLTAATAARPSPAPEFGYQWWVHRVETAGGWSEIDAGGHSKDLRRSGGDGGGYCPAAASGATAAVSTYCRGATGAATWLVASVTGITTGVTVAVLTENPPAGATAGVGAGVAIITIGTAASGGICPSIADFAGDAVTAVCKEPKAVSDDDLVKNIQFAPLLVGNADAAGGCPAGTVLYSGTAISCSQTFTEEDGAYVVENRCVEIQVSRQCVMM